MSAHGSRRPGRRPTTAAAPTPDAAALGVPVSRARRAVIGALGVSLTAAALTGAPALALDGPPPLAGAVEAGVAEETATLPDDDEVLPPAAPAGATARGTGDGQVEVSWSPSTSAPGTPEVSGYTVTAVPAAAADGPGVTVSTGPDVRTTTLEGLAPGEVHRVEIVASSTAGTSAPAVVRVRASSHVVPTAQAYTLRRPNADGKYPVLADGPSGAFGVQLDPAPGLVDPTVHVTVDGSTPTTTSPVFVPGASAGLVVRQDTTLRWLVVDGGGVVGPEGRQHFDVIESPHPAPTVAEVVAAPVSGAVDVGFARLPEPPVTAYRIQAYTGDSTDTATGIRVGGLVQFVPPADTTLTELVRRLTGLANGTTYRFSVAARYGVVWTTESALSAPVTPIAASAALAGPDQTVLRGEQFTLDGSASPRAVSYQWTQVRRAASPDGAVPQDPALDLNPHAAGVQSTTGPGTRPALTLTFPLLTTATSDHDLQFRLTTTHSDGSTRSDVVDVRGQADTVTVKEARWRDGDEIRGAGSQDGARLTLLHGGPQGALLGTAVVADGQWSLSAGPEELPGGSIHVWSDRGYTGTITTTE